MPAPDLEVPTPADAIGYGCVVVPDLDEYQGFFIRDNDMTCRRETNTVMLFAMGSGAHPIGALQAVCVDAVLKKDWGQLGIASLALASLTKHKFFWIKASKEPEGTRSEMFPLKATTVEEARAEIDRLPEVIELKNHLVESYRQPRH
jgi:hypothetical protein